MRIHFIQHEIFEAPGACLQWAKERNHSVSFSRVYLFDPLPDNFEHIDLLIIMGGPQSPNTTKDECPHFDAKAEMACIQKAIQAGIAVLGVCLGAQLIGQALGAPVERSPEKEIGVWPIELTPEGQKDENLSHFGHSLPTGHWHSDMPGLTASSKVLATSSGCPKQIICYAARVYGFQCHMELNLDVVELLIQEEEEFLTHNTVHQFVQKPDQIRSFNYRKMNHQLFVFLDKLMASKQSA